MKNMKKTTCIWTVLATAAFCSMPRETTGEESHCNGITIFSPNLRTENSTIDKAYRLAIGDLLTNIQDYQNGLLEAPTPVILAGLEYGRPWTRDASINSWNAGSLLVPDIARNTLLSVLLKERDGVRIAGQYWDAIIWSTAAWHHYLCTGNREFLQTAFAATRNSLAYFEKTEFDSRYGLFRGLGWSDGVAAYPNKYAQTNGDSAAWSWPKHNPDNRSKTGYGIPMMAASTNCLYYNAYKTAGRMAEELNLAHAEDWAAKAERLKTSINRYLWNEETGVYRFYIDPESQCDYQETLANAYAILFGIAGPTRTEKIFQHQYVAPAGVPCGWPPLPRYEALGANSFGRHNGTVWPQIQGMWADVAARHQKRQAFAHELLALATHAVRDMQFAEIYHPISGEKYGGWQEAGTRGIILWQATNRQTWAATAYLRMVFAGLFGMRIECDGIRFEPCVPKTFKKIALSKLRYRNMRIDITVEGCGTKVETVRINGKRAENTHIPNTNAGHQSIEITLR